MKIGEGNIHRCYKKRIQEYYAPLENKELKCPKCGIRDYATEFTRYRSNKV